jgi:TfoX/Sxy family transcriptional regulator of competence genes
MKRDGTVRSVGYDERTAARVRAILADRDDVEERPMFGGLCFLVNGRMACGLTKSEFMARVGKEGYEEALARAHVRPMDFTGRPLRGFVYVDTPALRTAAGLTDWVRRGVAIAEGEPATPRARKKGRRKR